MSRRGWVLAGLLALTLVAGLALLDPARDRPSVRSPLPDGYRAAFAYLEARGYAVEAWQTPLTRLENPAHTLVLAAPFARGVTEREQAALAGWMKRGGTLVFLPSGGDAAPVESFFTLKLDLPVEELEDTEPLSWDEWRTWKVEPRVFERVEAARWPAAPERLRAARASTAVNQPGGARTLYVDDEGASVVFEVPRGEGRLVVVNDASVFSNALLDEAGNLGLLETLAAGARARGGRILFDEWRHGYSDPASDRALTAGAFELLVAHLLVVYLATLWALGRRFGPSIVEPARLSGSVVRDLRAIAALHQRSGHARETGTLLLEGARRLGRGRSGVDELPERFEGDEKELLELARRIASLQDEGKL